MLPNKALQPTSPIFLAKKEPRGHVESNLNGIPGPIVVGRLRARPGG